MAAWKMVFPLLGYLSGSLVFSLWITRLLTGRDVRDAGSGHATTTNTIRQAGWLPGAAVFLLDFGKGFLPVWWAVRLDIPLALVAITAMAAVAGHCWPLFGGFRGGMGLAASAGCLTAISLLGLLIALGTLLFFVLILRHAARGSALAGLIAPWVIAALLGRGEIFCLALGVGGVIFIRFLSDWRRNYRELWLDRQEG